MDPDTKPVYGQNRIELATTRRASRLLSVIGACTTTTLELS